MTPTLACAAIAEFAPYVFLAGDHIGDNIPSVFLFSSAVEGLQHRTFCTRAVLALVQYHPALQPTYSLTTNNSGEREEI